MCPKWCILPKILGKIIQLALMSLLSRCPFSHSKWIMETMDKCIWPLCWSEIIMWNCTVIPSDNLKSNYNTPNIFLSPSASHRNLSYAYFLSYIVIIILEGFESAFQLILTDPKLVPSTGCMHTLFYSHRIFYSCALYQLTPPLGRQKTGQGGDTQWRPGHRV